jgi:hypothetical protein
VAFAMAAASCSGCACNARGTNAMESMVGEYQARIIAASRSRCFFGHLR